MEFCKYCGHQLEQNAIFCANCKKVIVHTTEFETQQTESQQKLTRTVEDAAKEPKLSQDKNAIHPATYKRKNSSATTAITTICCIIAVGIIALLYVNFFGGNNTNKLEGTYASGRSYILFEEDGACGVGHLYNDGLEIAATGTYELKGDTLILYLNYTDGKSHSITYTYNKSQDTITLTQSYFGTTVFKKVSS